MLIFLFDIFEAHEYAQKYAFPLLAETLQYEFCVF